MGHCRRRPPIRSRAFFLKDFLPLSVFVGLIARTVNLTPFLGYTAYNVGQEWCVQLECGGRLAWFSDPSGVSDYSEFETENILARRRPIKESRDVQSWEAGPDMHMQHTQRRIIQYLSFMLDHGLIGALVIPMLLVTIMWGAQGQQNKWP